KQTYNTYSTVFTVDPSSTTITATLVGKRVSINSQVFEKVYSASGDSVELTCPIASDPAMTIAMYDHYRAVSEATRFEFTMRDDPALDVGDRVNIKLMSERAYGVWNYVLVANPPTYTDDFNRADGDL